MSCDQVSEIDKLKLQKIANLLEQKKQLKAVNLDAGKGGYGQVIIVQDSSQKEFAIKVISIFDGVDDISEIKKKDAEDEAQNLKNFPHPNIVKYFDDYQIGNNYFILMERCEKSLQQLVDSKEELSEDLIMKFIFEISEAISFLHSKNLVLRDVSLKNILLDKEQNIKLCDFGLIKKIDSTLAQEAFLTSRAKGTPYYQPPELIEALKSNQCYQTKQGDIWAFGICLYLLVGGDVCQIPSFNNEIEEQNIPQKYSSRINNLIIQVLQKYPQKRPSAEQIVEYLVEFTAVQVPLKQKSYIQKYNPKYIRKWAVCTTRKFQNKQVFPCMFRPPFLKS